MFFTLTAPVNVPLLIEIKETLWSEESKGRCPRQFRLTTLIAKLLNMERCLDLPSDQAKVLTFHHQQSKSNANRKYKFILLEDTLQIVIQLGVGSRYGVTGFWSLVSPAIGTLSLIVKFGSFTTGMRLLSGPDSNWQFFSSFRPLFSVSLGSFSSLQMLRLQKNGGIERLFKTISKSTYVNHHHK